MHVPTADSLKTKYRKWNRTSAKGCLEQGKKKQRKTVRKIVPSSEGLSRFPNSRKPMDVERVEGAKLGSKCGVIR